MLSRAFFGILFSQPSIHPQQQHTDVQMADPHASQALPPSKEPHSNDRIPAKGHTQSEKPHNNSIHSVARVLSEHNQVVLDHSAHETGVEMRTQMSDADMENQQIGSEHNEEASYTQEPSREQPGSMDFSSQPSTTVQQQMTSNAPPSSGFTASESFNEAAPNQSPHHAGEQETHEQNMIFQPQPSRGSSANSLLVQHSTYDEERRRLERTVIPDSDFSFHGASGQAAFSPFPINAPMQHQQRLPPILGPSVGRFPARRVQFMGVPDSPASSLAPESYYSGSQYGDFSPEDNLVFDRPSSHYSPSMQSNPRPAPRRMIPSMTEGPRHVQESRMNSRRMAPGSMGGRVMGFPPVTGPPSSIYSENSPRVMTMRPPPVRERRLMSEGSPFSSPSMGPSSPNMTSPYAPGANRYREREHMQPYGMRDSPSQRQQHPYVSSPLRGMNRPVTAGRRQDPSSSRQRSMSPESESEAFYDAEEELEPPKRKPGRQKMPGMCNAVGETPPLFNHFNFANGFTEEEMANVVWKGPPLPGYGPRVEMPINNRRGPVGRTRGGVSGDQNHHFRRVCEMSTPYLPPSPRFEPLNRPRYDPEAGLYEPGPEQLPVSRRLGERIWTVEDLRRARALLSPAQRAEMDRLDEEEEMYTPEEEFEIISKGKATAGRGKGRGGAAARGPGSRGGKVKGTGRGATTVTAKVSKPKAKGKEKEKTKAPAKPRKSKKAVLSAEAVEPEPSEAGTEEMGRQLIAAMNSEFPPVADAEGEDENDQMQE